MTDDLMSAIFETIASRTPFSVGDVRTAYERCHSFDMVISAANMAATWGFDSVSGTVRMIKERLEKLEKSEMNFQDKIERGVIRFNREVNDG